ncbi:hypothetical protein L596_011989 [Steinernema carpocapsae]|uniref:Uncharacterized protein n=1 Tax=Steinernema carpocapsae TaxID=34508 RepID=A0A4U5NVM8_STECR|nr:hypothetical protein L596_011989 [Steinernema carpocapsae]
MLSTISKHQRTLFRSPQKTIPGIIDKTKRDKADVAFPLGEALKITPRAPSLSDDVMLRRKKRHKQEKECETSVDVAECFRGTKRAASADVTRSYSSVSSSSPSSLYSNQPRRRACDLATKAKREKRDKVKER